MELQKMTRQDQMKNWESLFDSVPIDTDPREEHQRQLKDQLKDGLNNKSDSAFDNQSRPQSRIQNIGSILMKYKIPHLATAAALLIAFSITFHSGGPQALALDSVFAKIINAKFARWDMVVEFDDGSSSTTRVSITPERTRHDEDDGSYMVFDWSSGKSVAFFPDDKTAMEMDSNTSGMGLQSVDTFKSLQEALKTQLELGIENIETLGERDVDGQTLTGFKVSDQIAIWVNPRTQSAVRIEVSTGVEGASNVILENYESDIDFEAGCFSLELPAGYSNIVTTDRTPEESLILALRVSCEVSGGTFPNAFDLGSLAEVFADSLEHSMAKMEITRQPTAKQMSELLNGNGGFELIYTLYDDERADAHYAGANVKLGEKDRPIFWYKPTGFNDYRVIFADLEVKVMSSPPKVEGTVPLSISK
jgi:outer membrane lipoprotein-sorting protein